jgi:hypothetical protein
MKYICAYHVNDRSDDVNIFAIEAKDQDEAEEAAKLVISRIHDMKIIAFTIEEFEEIRSFKLTKKIIEEKDFEEINNILIK